MGTSIITPKFIEKMRSSDYQSTSYAFAEIIDNSFDAMAKTVRIVCIEKRDRQKKRYIDEILFTDDGSGMDDTTLNNCLTFAYGTNENIEESVRNKKIGKFGMGLPNSSISQCKNVAVYSKTKGSNWRKKYLSIKELLDNHSTELADFTETGLPSYYESLEAVIDKNQGTIVSWKDCDRLDRQYADTLYKRAEGILGRLFRYHLSSGCTIELTTYLHNEEDDSLIEQLKKRVVLNDPLFLAPNAYITKQLREAASRDESIEDEDFDPATYYAKFVAGLPSDESRPTSIRLEAQSYEHPFEWKGKVYTFKFKTSYAHIDIQKPGIREGGRTKVGAVYGDKMKDGNIYFTRHQREISCGHYGFYTITAENNRWWTIEIDFDADADELMGVSNTKQGIKFNKTLEDDSSTIFDKHTATLQQAREKLWFDLTNKINRAVREVSNVVRLQAQEFEDRSQPSDDGGTQVPTGTDQTTQAIKTTDRQRQGRFDEEQRKDLTETLKSRFKTLTNEEIKHAVDRFDRALVRGCVIYCPIEENNQLWSFSEIRGFLIIYINTNHDFYNNIIAPFRNAGFDTALTGIELFISSLAWEQNEHFDNDATKKRNLDNFRSYVGIHLNNYLQENDIKITQEDLNQLFNEHVA